MVGSLFTVFICWPRPLVSPCAESLYGGLATGLPFLPTSEPRKQSECGGKDFSGSRKALPSRSPERVPENGLGICPAGFVAPPGEAQTNVENLPRNEWSQFLDEDGSRQLTPNLEGGWHLKRPDQHHMSLEKN